MIVQQIQRFHHWFLLGVVLISLFLIATFTTPAAPVERGASTQSTAPSLAVAYTTQ